MFLHGCPLLCLFSSSGPYLIAARLTSVITLIDDRLRFGFETRKSMMDYDRGFQPHH